MVYGEFAGAPSREELERFFFLDDANKDRVAAAGEHRTYATTFFRRDEHVLVGKTRALFGVLPVFMAPIAKALEEMRPQRSRSTSA